MAIRIIVKHPDAILRERAKEVTKFNANLHKLLDDMAATMYDAPGVGLAAPQIGISKRIVVIDVEDDHGLIELVNPEIIFSEGEQVGPEGCLSIPGINGEVARSQFVRVKAADRHGKPVVLEGRDMLARAIQHEIDHLNGILFIDLAENIYRVDQHDRKK